MNFERKLERTIFKCPEINCDDYLKYPLVDEDCFINMENRYREDSSRIHIFIYVRGNDSYSGYVDVYVWDSIIYPYEYERFVICNGFRLPDNKEDKLFEYIDKVKAEYDFPYENDMDEIFKKINRIFGEWKYVFYHGGNIGWALSHLYFASHNSGCREILYKAQLNHIALNIDKISEHDIMGSTPEKIIGYNLPIRVLRMLNNAFMITYLYDEDKIKLCKQIYDTYAGYMDSDEVSFSQWYYLEQLTDDEGVFAGKSFSRTVYRNLRKKWSALYVQNYARFFELRDELNDILGTTDMRIPNADSVRLAVKKMEHIKYYRDNRGGYSDRMVRGRCLKTFFDYKGKDYSVIMPSCEMDIVNEAIAQGNCLMDYIHKHARGETTILFVRENDNIDKPFVTIEIFGGSINQIYGLYNSLPERSVFEFLKEYSEKRWVNYDPYNFLIDNYSLIEESEYYDELFEYLDELSNRKYAV